MSGAEECVREMGRQRSAEKDEEDREEGCAEDESEEEGQGGWLSGRSQEQAQIRGIRRVCVRTASLLLRPESALVAAGFFRCPCFPALGGVDCLVAPFAAGRHVTA